MLEVGSTVEAEVKMVKPYGVYLEHAGHEILVLIPEVSWNPTHNLEAAVRVGDRRKVYLLRYIYQKKQYAGSFRRLQPEENPYRVLSRLPPGEVLPGRVGQLLGDEWTIHLPNGAYGHVPNANACMDWHHGDRVAVRIAALEVDEGRLTLASAHTTDTITNGSREGFPGKPTLQPTT